MTDNISPNTQGAATEQNSVPSMDSIAAKMTAMREQTAQAIALRNQEEATKQTETGIDNSAEDSIPVAPDAVPEVSDDDFDIDESNQNTDSPEEVTTDGNDSTSNELIDFIEFAETNPNAKFKFVRNGQEIVIDAKKAAAILGQGSAIHEDARKLKIERAEFDEYLKDTRARQEGLALAMEFTIQPKLKSAFDEIVRTQGYQTTFQQQLNQTRDPAQVARIQASMAQNEQYIRQQQQVISQLRPAVDEFRQIRTQQVGSVLTEMRKNFTDKELKNEYVFNELRDKLSKVWRDSKTEIVPGIPNIDLVSSDEQLLSLVRDGLRYRDKPTAKNSGNSFAALTSRKGSTTQRSSDDGLSKLREQANRGDKKASDNLLVQRMNQIRAGRGGR
jgi:hypothetical protein